MPAILPQDLTYGRVIGLFKTIETDSNDPDEYPDHFPMTGTITFTPSVSRLTIISDTPGESATFGKDRVTCVLDENGRLVKASDPSVPGVLLLASDNPLIQTQGWTWRVDFSLKSSNSGANMSVPAMDITVLSGETLDIAKLVPTTSSPGLGIPAMEAAVLRAEAAASRVVISPTNPQMTQPGLWIQTGLGDGSDFTFWIEDGQ